jgi:hypothetical protein
MIEFIRKVISKIKFILFQLSIINNFKLNNGKNDIEYLKNNFHKLSIGKNSLQNIGLQRVDGLKKSFCNKLEHEGSLVNIAIHLPPYLRSPGGYSLFRNLASSLNYLGINTHLLPWDCNFKDFISTIKPNIFITSDHHESLRLIDWCFLDNYKKKNSFKIGLTANYEKDQGLTLESRLHLMADKIDFYYSFKDPDYVSSSNFYQPYRDFGHKILFYEFGVNPLIYFPVDNDSKKYDFIFLGSSNPVKRNLYYKFFSKIFRKHHGYINGPGWIHAKKFIFDATLDKFAYSLGRVGLNLSIEEQLSFPSELNERTYMLAACGIPQLIDNPKLLPKHFSSDAYFSAINPDDYYDLFLEIISNTALANKRASIALDEVFASHTTFHRSEIFFKQLKSLL